MTTGTRLTTTATAERQLSATSWQIDPAHSLIEFSVKHMMFTTVRGRFNKLCGTIVCPDESDPTKASVEAVIDAASIAGFTAETTLNRREFGLNWNAALESGGLLVGDKVNVLIEIQAVRQE